MDRVSVRFLLKYDIIALSKMYKNLSEKFNLTKIDKIHFENDIFLMKLSKRFD